MERKDKLLNVYNEPDKLIDEDMIQPLEGAFMEGFNEDMGKQGKNIKKSPPALLKQEQKIKNTIKKAERKIQKLGISDNLTQKEEEKAIKIEKKFLDKGYDDKIAALVAVDRAKTTKIN